MENKLESLKKGLENAKSMLNDLLQNKEENLTEIARTRKLIDTLEHTIKTFDFIEKTTPNVINTILVQLKMKKLL